eukprot:127314_1
METFIANKVVRYLHIGDYTSAIFLVERVHAEVNTERTLFQLAKCYHDSGKFNVVFELLKDTCCGRGVQQAPPDTRYLFAVSAYKLGKLNEAEACMLGRSSVLSAAVPSSDMIPGGASGMNLLGRICLKGTRNQEAEQYFQKSIAMDPFMWSSFKALCELGSFVPVESMFVSGAGSPPTEMVKSSSLGTPPSAPDPSSYRPPAAPRKGASRTARRASPLPDSTSDVLLKPLNPALSTQTPPLDNNHVPDWFNSLGNLLRIFAVAYQMLCAYQCAETVRVLLKLPRKHYETAWVLQVLGRAYFEVADYNKAKEVFQQMLDIAPYQLRGLEVYSTVLWHLNDETELAYLAQKATQFDRLAPETWVVVGNCFSLQKEHDTAIKFFQRALQLDRTFTYAYTLAAHEYVSTEDFDKATQGYRHAIRYDSRHYNAWFGLGNIYFRQENYDMAIQHFDNAFKINQQSSVLCCYLGMALHAAKKYSAALKTLERACALKTTNALALYERASVFFSLNKFEDALTLLDRVLEQAPTEAAAHFLRGKVLRALGRREKAVAAFSATLDLEPSDRSFVKAQIDRTVGADGDGSGDAEEGDGSGDAEEGDGEFL